MPDVTLSISLDLAQRFRDGRIRSWDHLTPGEQDDVFAQMLAESVRIAGPAPVGKGFVITGVVVNGTQTMLAESVRVRQPGVGWVACEVRNQTFPLLIHEAGPGDTQTVDPAASEWFVEGLYGTYDPGGVPPAPVAFRQASDFPSPV